MTTITEYVDALMKSAHTDGKHGMIESAATGMLRDEFNKVLSQVEAALTQLQATNTELGRANSELLAAVSEMQRVLED